VDISSIGAQLETGHSLAIGEAVELDLPQLAETPEAKGGHQVAGRVVWVKEAAPDLQRYHIGLTFSQPLREATKILANFRYRLV
jgi:Tfp pilus assembly protein PilZ